VQRRLILMRHAKAADHSPTGRDHGRPLAKRGLRDAANVADMLRALGWSPSEVVSSDAVRTRETWSSMQDAVPLQVPVSFHPQLYLAGLAAIRGASSEWDNHADGPVLLLGHNPGWETAASQLSGEFITMTTANAVLLECTAETWIQALSKRWTLIHHLVPPKT